MAVSEGSQETLDVRLLGPVEVRRGGGVVPLGGVRPRAVLAYLALHANRVVPRERLIDALWGEEPPSTAANALQVAVHALRKALGADRIVTRGSGYELRLAPGELDTERFRQMTEEDPGRLRDALDLWRGPALADLEALPFAVAEAGRLEDLRLDAVERGVDADLGDGRHAEVVDQLEAFVVEHPYRERATGQLALALYRCGRQADALDALRRTRARLVDELGIDPGAELQELERAILRQDGSLAGTAEPATAPGNLPTPPTPLVGRRLELVAVEALLRDSGVRLVTLTGPGGTGKTRLAVEIAGELSAEFPDGAYFVDLSALRDAALVAPTIADVVGVGEQPGRPVLETLAGALADRRVLLVLDNFERVTEAAADVARLLSATRGAKALVTSRAPLRLSGEHEYAVPPLEVPRPAGDPTAAARTEAVELFVARARAARHDFRLNDANAAAVARLCVALDGLPLALELAAARMRILSPTQMLERIDRRLDLLTGGARDLPPRQRSLRAAIDGSYELLDARERATFAALAVFAGGFDVGAATAVCDATLDELGTLVDQSLVRRDESSDGSARFRLLETVREYALGRLDADGGDDVRRRHAEYLIALAEEAEPHLIGEEAATWLERLDREHDNFRAAIAWAGATGRTETELRLAGTLQRFWRVRGHLAEGAARLEEAVARGGDAPPAVLASATYGAGILRDKQGDRDEAQAYLSRALELFREAGLDVEAARTLAELGGIAILTGDYDRGAELLEQTLPLFRAADDTRAVMVVTSNLSSLYSMRGDVERALAVGREALELARTRGDKDQLTISLHNIARLRLADGAVDEAAGMLDESLSLAHELGYRELIAYCLHGCGEVAGVRGDPARGARLIGAATGLFEEIGAALGVSEQEDHEAAVERLTGALGADGFTRLEREGRALSLDAAVAEARGATTAASRPS